MAYALFIFFLPLFVGLAAWRSQQKFRLWALEDVLFIKKGIFGEERILLQWHKLQSVQLTQTMFQRKKGLASLHLTVAGGTVTIPFIFLHVARQLKNFALYKVESAHKPWF